MIIIWQVSCQTKVPLDGVSEYVAQVSRMKGSCEMLVITDESNHYHLQYAISTKTPRFREVLFIDLVFYYRINATISSATMFTILIIGLMAGPAVSLYGSPTVSPVTAAWWAIEPLPP